jgi:hypothetical protein
MKPSSIADASLLFNPFSSTSVLPVTTTQNTLKGFIIPLAGASASIPTLPTGLGLTATPLMPTSTIFKNAAHAPVILNPQSSSSTSPSQSSVLIDPSQSTVSIENNTKKPVRLNNISITPIESNNSLLSQFSTVSTPSGTAIMHTKTINSYFMNKSNLDWATKSPKRSSRKAANSASSNNNKTTTSLEKSSSHDPTTSEASTELNSTPTKLALKEKELDKTKNQEEELNNDTSAASMNTSNESLKAATPEKQLKKCDLLKKKNDSIVESIDSTLETLNKQEKKAERALAPKGTPPKKGLPIMYRVGSRKRLVQSIENSFVNMETSKYGNEQQQYKTALNALNGQNEEKIIQQKETKDQEPLNHTNDSQESTKLNHNKMKNGLKQESDSGRIICSICFREFPSKCEPVIYLRI